MTRCDFGLHVWGKWEEYSVKIRRIAEVNYQDVWLSDVQHAQKRSCNLCGKIQRAAA